MFSNETEFSLSHDSILPFQLWKHKITHFVLMAPGSHAHLLYLRWQIKLINFAFINKASPNKWRIKRTFHNPNFLQQTVVLGRELKIQNIRQTISNFGLFYFALGLRIHFCWFRVWSACLFVECKFWYFCYAKLELPTL